MESYLNIMNKELADILKKADENGTLAEVLINALGKNGIVLVTVDNKGIDVVSGYMTETRNADRDRALVDALGDLLNDNITEILNKMSIKSKLTNKIN